MTQETKEQGCQLLLESHDGYNKKEEMNAKQNKCLKFKETDIKISCAP